MGRNAENVRTKHDKHEPEKNADNNGSDFHAGMVTAQRGNSISKFVVKVIV